MESDQSVRCSPFFNEHPSIRTLRLRHCWPFTRRLPDVRRLKSNGSIWSLTLSCARLAFVLCTSVDGSMDRWMDGYISIDFYPLNLSKSTLGPR